MGLFEEIVSMMEKKKQPIAQNIGFSPSEIPPDLQQEMMKDPTLAERIRQYLIEQKMRNQIQPMNNSGSIVLRG